MTRQQAQFGSTLFFLMGQYGSRAMIPAVEVCRDYFPHLSLLKFIRKCDEGDIPLPLMRIESSKQGARGVHVQDLANYIDRQAERARNYRRYDDSTDGTSAKKPSD
jgi:hypothetical protein